MSKIAEVMIWDPVDRILWGLGLGVAFLCSILYVIRAKQLESKMERAFMYGFANFVFWTAVSRFFFLLSDLQIKGEYIGLTFYGDFNSVTPLYEVFQRLCWITIDIGFIIILIIFEKYIIRTKYILTMISIVVCVIVLLSPFELANFIQNSIFAPFIVTMSILALLVTIKYSQPELKPVAPLLTIGLSLMVLSMVISSPEFRSLNTIPLIISPLLYIFGNLLIILPMVINPEYFSRHSRLIIYIFSFTLVISAIIYQMYYVFSIPVVMLIILIPLISIGFIYFFIKIIKGFKSKELIEERKELEGLLGVFTRPQRITEEEVSISKEKKICLVCKGKVLRNSIYLCPICDTFYCLKCSMALSNLENACWVCETPFDESKPVVLKEKKKEELKMDERDHKKKGDSN